MLSDPVAFTLSWISLAGIFITVFMLFGFYEASYDYDTMTNRIASALRVAMLIAFIGVLIYSMVSLFANQSHQVYEKISKTAKEKYGIVLTEEENKKLYSLIDDFDETEELLYGSGSTKINGKETIAIWRQNELFLMEYNNGKLEELSAKPSQ